MAYWYWAWLDLPPMRKSWLAVKMHVAPGTRAHLARSLATTSSAVFVRSPSGELNAFLLKNGAEKWSKAHGGEVVDYTGARESLVASR